MVKLVAPAFLFDFMEAGTTLTFPVLHIDAEVAKLVDAHVSGACGLCPCGFDPHLRHHIPYQGKVGATLTTTNIFRKISVDTLNKQAYEGNLMRVRPSPAALWFLLLDVITFVIIMDIIYTLKKDALWIEK